MWPFLKYKTGREPINLVCHRGTQSSSSALQINSLCASNPFCTQQQLLGVVSKSLPYTSMESLRFRLQKRYFLRIQVQCARPVSQRKVLSGLPIAETKVKYRTGYLHIMGKPWCLQSDWVAGGEICAQVLSINVVPQKVYVSTKICAMNKTSVPTTCIWGCFEVCGGTLAANIVVKLILDIQFQVNNLELKGLLQKV